MKLDDQWIIIIKVGVVAAASFALGLFIADDSVQIRRLSSTLSDLEREAASQRSVATVTQVVYSVQPSPATDTTVKLTPEQEMERIKASKLEEMGMRREAELRAEYSEVFSRLGLAPEKAELLITNLISIHQSSKSAEKTLAGLSRARGEFLNRLEAEMSPEALRSFKQHEEMKPAIREFNELSQYATDSQGVSIPPEAREPLLELLTETRAYTSESWQGPYDGPPQPASGARMVLASMERRLGQLEQAREQILERARELAWPQESLDVLVGYYDSKIQGMQSNMEFLQKSPEERRAIQLENARAEIERLRAARRR